MTPDQYARTQKKSPPVIAKPVVAPSVAVRPPTAPSVPVRPAGGSADARERQAVAAKYGITQSAAANKINAQGQSMLAMQGSKNSAGARAGGSADRRETANVAAIYGVGQSQGQKISNTQVDVQRAAKGLPPVFKPTEKVTRIPNPLVASSAKGSLASGWQSTGPVSSTTGNPLVANLTSRDASQDLRQRTATPTVNNTGTVTEPPVYNEGAVVGDTAGPANEDALARALSLMSGSPAFANAGQVESLTAASKRTVRQNPGEQAMAQQLTPYESRVGLNIPDYGFISPYLKGYRSQWL